MDLVEVVGKQDSKVPVLLTPQMRTAMDVMVETRELAGVPDSNQYFFAKVGFTLKTWSHHINRVNRTM